MFLAPVLSAQFITDATGKQFEIFSLIPFLPKHSQSNSARLDLHTSFTGENQTQTKGLSLERLGFCEKRGGVVTYLLRSLIDSVFNNK